MTLKCTCRNDYMVIIGIVSKCHGCTKRQQMSVMRLAKAHTNHKSTNLRIK